MEESSWRFRPIQGNNNNICPTCSISHFPFCPPPLPLDRFPAFHRPPPFLDHPPPPPPLMPRPPPMRGNQVLLDGYGDSSYRQFPPPHERDTFYPPPRFDYGTGNEFLTRDFVQSDRINKRMRLGEMDLGSFPPMPPPPLAAGVYNGNATRISIEDERRLNLIRDHGVPSKGPELHTVDTTFRGDTGFEIQPGRQFHGYSQLGDHAKFEESRRSEWEPLGMGSTKGWNSFHHSRFDSGVGANKSYDERKELQRGESGLIRNKEGGGKDSFFPSPNEPPQQALYGDSDSLRPLVHRYGSSNVPANYVNTSGEKDDQFVNWGQQSFPNSKKSELNQYPHISHNAHYGTAQDDNYDPYHPQAKCFNQAQEFQHPYVSNTMFNSGSDVPTPENKQNLQYYGQKSDVRRSFQVGHPSLRNTEGSAAPQHFLEVEQFGSPGINSPGSYLPMSTANGMTSTRQVQVPASGAYGFRPPLPPLPPPPLPMEPPGPPPSYQHGRASPPKTSSSIYTSPVAAPLLHPSAFEGQPFPKNPLPDKPKIIDASCLFKQPNRATRPDHIVIILRGLPGSGKSYLAKMLRDLEVESGGDAPRIHSMDEYFMTEVEKVEESSVKGKKRTVKKVLEYCYEPEMEEAYRASMLKAFKKTLDEGTFTFIIVDDRNLRVADFAQFWASAKRSGYEVYLLEAMYKDPVGCAARNVHGFTSDDIKRMAELWEDAPSLYLRLDIQSLCSGDDLKEHGIQEVDMDMEDTACEEGPSGLLDIKSMKTVESPSDDCATHGSSNDEGRWDAERDDTIGIKDLGRSKWSHDVDDKDIEKSHCKGNLNALSGLIQAYSKGDKSVHWGDKAGKTGFSIGATKRANAMSLIIGPGAGYNLKSNPLEKEEVATINNGWKSKKHNVFQQQLQAEHESFRAVFDRRRQRISGLAKEEE